MKAHNVVVDSEMNDWVVDFGRGGKGAKEQLSSGDDGDGGARRKLEMEKELEGIDAMMEVLLSLGPEDSRGLGPFYLHEG